MSLIDKIYDEETTPIELACEVAGLMFQLDCYKKALELICKAPADAYFTNEPDYWYEVARQSLSAKLPRVESELPK